MANTDKPNGFTPVKMLDGSPYNGAVDTYYIPTTESTAIFRGSPVKLAGGADADGIPTVTLAASNDAAVGVVTDIDFQPANLSLNYHPGATGYPMYVKVAPAQGVIYEIQEDSSTAFTAADVGLNAGFTAESGNTTTGMSTIELDCSTENTTNTLSLQILRLVQRPNNAIGTNAKWEVRFNDVQYTNQLAGVS